MNARAQDIASDRLLSALRAIPADCDRDTWIKVGMAAKSEGLSFEDFDNWSSKGENYGGLKETRRVWDSFKEEGGIRGATLIHIAREHGWSGDACTPSRRGAPRHPRLVSVPMAARHQSIPADAPMPPRAHPEHGAPSVTWTYRDAHARTLFHVCRFDTEFGGKQFAPLTFDGGRWRWMAPEAPRPLYGLDRLAASPGALVVVCEGEKAADAACKLIADAVAVTSPNGAQGARKADWSPLRGRRVVVWPDVDAPGKKYGQAVVELASEAGATVAGIVNVPALVDGRELPEGWDAADALAEGVALRTADALPLMPVNGPASPADVPTIGPHNLSEDALALAFEARYADKLRFCHTSGSWFRWTGTRWEQERTQLAFTWAREICREVGGGHAKFAKAATAGAVEKFACAAPRFAITADKWDRDPWLIATPAGTVDLRTGELRDARPSEHITKLTGVAPADAGSVPKRWLSFLDEATGGDESVIRFLQQICGYALTGATTEHALFFIYGAGGNGKSVFLNILSAILGEYSATAAMDTFTASKYERHSTDLAMLKGARLVTASETEDGRAWAEARIKQMTGGDPITARYMRRDNFTYRPEFKLVITGNHKPRLNNVDDATRRRFNIIPFKRRPAVPDPRLEEALLAELGSIFRWAIDGCLDWQRNGLIRPTAVEEETRDYFEDQDVFGQWIAERCERGVQFKEMSQQLFSSWRGYARAASEDAGSAKAFGEAMRKRGFEPFRTKHGRGFLGLRLVADAPVPDMRIPDDW